MKKVWGLSSKNITGAHFGPAMQIALPLFILFLGVGFPLLGLLHEFSSLWTHPSKPWERLQSPWVQGAINFTLWQSLVSASLTCAIAVPLSFLFAKLRFPGRDFLLSLSIVPFALPSIVVAFSFVIIYGNSGFVSNIFSFFGIEVTLLYNKWAIVAAHCFFNLPFTLRLLTLHLTKIPHEYYRLASLLGLPKWRTLLHIDLPHLVLPLTSAFLLTFLLCLSSFAITMVLGGHPSLTTLEVAIYQLIRFEFDLEAAVLLAVLQLGLTATATSLYWLAHSTNRQKLETLSTPNQISLQTWSRFSFGVKLLSGVFIGSYALFLLLPFIGILSDGAVALRTADFKRGDLISSVQAAAFHSFSLAILAGLITTLSAWFFARGCVLISSQFPWLAKLIPQSLWIVIGLSPTVLSFAWFLQMRNWVDPFTYAAPAVLMVHVINAFPLCVRPLLPAVQQVMHETARARASLGIKGLKSLFMIELPALKGHLSLAFALGFAFSFGEVAAVALFGGPDFETLPLLLYRLMQNYRFAEAALISCLLGGLCGAVFYFGERKYKS